MFSFPKISKLISSILLLSVFVSFVACQKIGGSGSSTPPTPTICPLGQVALNGICTIPGGSLASPQMEYYTSKTDPKSTSDTLVMEAGYSDFLKNGLGVCERCKYSVGEALQCSSWARGFNLIRLEFLNGSTNQVRLHFYSTPRLSNSYVQYAWSFPDIGDFFLSMFTGVPAPSCNPGQYSPYWYSNFYLDTTNNGAGFVAYGQGPSFSKWNRNVIRLFVDNGKMGDSLLSYRVIAITSDNKQLNLAHGTLQRCQSYHCGIN